VTACIAPRQVTAAGLLAAAAITGGILAGGLSANAVTGTDAAKAKAAAIKAVGSGTAGAVTTDVSGNGYEVTVTKSDGAKVEVHLNGSFGVDDHGRTAG
jgi:hypothetical protein